MVGSPGVAIWVHPARLQEARREPLVGIPWIPARSSRIAAKPASPRAKGASRDVARGIRGPREVGLSSPEDSPDSEKAPITTFLSGTTHALVRGISLAEIGGAQ